MKLLLLPPFHRVLFVGESLRAHGEWGVRLPSSKAEQPHKLFGILLYGRFVSSPHLFIYTSMDLCIFILNLGVKFSTALLCCSDRSSCGHWELFQVAPVSL